MSEICKTESFNPLPQNAPGSFAAVGHKIENSIPLSIFPVAADKFCIALCGLPGRGKTHIAKRLARYLSFFHAIPVKVFTISEYRRRMFGALKGADWFDPANTQNTEMREECTQKAIEDVIVFLNQYTNGIAILDSSNATHAKRAALVRTILETGAKTMFIEVSNDDQDFLEQQYRQQAQTSPDYQGVTDSVAVKDYRKRIDNYKLLFEPVDHEDTHAVECKWSYMKCDHSRQHFVVHNMKGYLQQKVSNFIMNLRTTSHAFYLSRHGQSEYNELGRIGGDSGLTTHGMNYAKKLADFVETNIKCPGDVAELLRADSEKLLSRAASPTAATAAAAAAVAGSESFKTATVATGTPISEGLSTHSPSNPSASLDSNNNNSSTNNNSSSSNGSNKSKEVRKRERIEVPTRLWTSNMRRTKETAQFIKQNKILIKNPDDPSVEYEWVQMRPRAWHHLDELFAGGCDGMTYEEIEQTFPDEWKRRSVDKLAYRYPRGESYLDVIARLEPMIIEMERHQEPLLIVAHQGILRIIYAFYMGYPRNKAPYVSIPLNTVIQLVPSAYDCVEMRYKLYDPAQGLKSDGQDEIQPSTTTTSSSSTTAAAAASASASRGGAGVDQCSISQQVHAIPGDSDISLMLYKDAPPPPPPSSTHSQESGSISTNLSALAGLGSASNDRLGATTSNTAGTSTTSTAVGKEKARSREGGGGGGGGQPLAPISAMTSSKASPILSAASDDDPPSH